MSTEKEVPLNEVHERLTYCKPRDLLLFGANMVNTTRQPYNVCTVTISNPKASAEFEKFRKEALHPRGIAEENFTRNIYKGLIFYGTR